jgi:signal transduction histidine kinase
MLKTLRRRLILSHALPLLVTIPLVGIALVYVLETQVLLPNLADGLTGDAKLIANIVAEQPEIWQNPAQAQALLTHLNPGSTARAMLLDPRGRLLASTDPNDAQRLGQTLDNTDLAQALNGQVSVHRQYSRQLHADIADVLVPVVAPDQQVIGVVWLSHQLTGVRAWFLRLRFLVAGVLVVGLLFGAAVGWVLAAQLSRPVRNVTGSVYQLASGQRLKLLPEQGPEEMQLLAHAINILAERWRKSEQANRQLLSNLVHELGRPLGAWYSAVQALQDGAAEDIELRDELLSGMAVEVRSLQRLLDDLSRLHERSAGKFRLQRRATALSKWLPQVLGPWREAGKAKGLDWESVIPTDLPVLDVDPNRLNQAVGNLLSNAIKYTPPGGKLSLRAGVKDDAVWIRVSDTGPGISAEHQAHVFTPFYRVPQTGEQQKGIGLGLSIARDLTVAHGGQLEVESTPGSGSHFTLWLPTSGKGTNGPRERKTPLSATPGTAAAPEPLD